MRHVALLSMVFAAAGVLLATGSARATCSRPPCVDAEPAWQAPASARFAWVSETTAPTLGGLAAGLSLGFRLHPAILTVPAPSRDGRDVNLLRYALDATLGLRVGLGNRMELTAVAPVGLYQRGAGIKGITDQQAPPIPARGLHDARLGFGYELDTGTKSLGAKLRFEAKLPVGNADALGGEASPVASPSLALSGRRWGFHAGVELGARLRRPVEFYGARVGSQALLAVGIGYELSRPRLSFTFEEYLLPSLVARTSSRHLPAEWLLGARLAPVSWRGWSLGVAAGGGLPFSETPDGHALALGVPALRALSVVSYVPDAVSTRP